MRAEDAAATASTRPLRKGVGAMDVKELMVGPERVWALIFEAADEAMSGLTSFARDAGLAGARFQAVGAFASVTVGWFDVARHPPRRRARAFAAG
jgi:hypothetical protein